ncbi:MAG: hypothetical protein AB8B65_00490 [Kordia sp.]|uniref:hypothetical protein n=1 Tax=Kordia sp. TaxID=1965332 RepID=UPI00385C54E3
MKKIIYYLIPCMFSFLVIGCSEDDRLLENTEDTTLQDIRQLTDDFLKVQDKITIHTKAIDPAVAAVDIKAAIDSYNNDPSDMDSVYADGIAASGLASSGIAQPNPGSGADNTGNPLDHAGKYHVDILHHQLTQQYNYVAPNGVFNYDRSVEVTRNLLVMYGENVTQSNSHTSSSFNVYYNKLRQELQSVNNLLSKAILKMRAQGKISSLESQILHSYFTMQEGATSLNSYIQYSIQVEQMVLNSSYPQSTKDFLLFTMATARHDFNYWNPYGV